MLGTSGSPWSLPKFLLFLSGMSRASKIAFQIVLDAALIIFSFCLAMYLRLETITFLSSQASWFAIVFATSVAVAAFWHWDLYRTLIRFLTGKILLIVAKGALVSAIALYAGGLLFDASLPRSVPFIFAILVFLSVGGLRFTTRYLFRKPNQVNKKPVIIYGAGEAGRQLLNSLFHGREYAPVAMVDDDPGLQHLTVGGLGVFAPSEIPRLLKDTRAQVILLAIPSVGRARRREIVAQLEDLPVQIKTIPGISDIISGKSKISELRTVSALDLLGRDPVPPEPGLLK